MSDMRQDMEDGVCAECGYDWTMHRAYAAIDGGGPELGAYLGGRWHPFRLVGPDPEAAGAETGTPGKGATKP